MKILVAAVAEHAWVESGCLSLCRTFDTINAPDFPYKMSRISIAVRLLINESEAGQHELQISLSNADGKEILNTNIDMNVQVPQGSVPESSFSFALNGQNVVFEKPGDYVVNILVDQQPMASIPIYVREKK